jgi:hypothetical protein
MLQGKRRPSNVNEPSIAIGSLAGKEHVTRMVTNVTNKRETYRATVQGVKGVNVKVSPSTITVGPGRVQKFTVNFTATNAARFKKYATGHLVWKGSQGHTVRSPIAVRPVAVSVPGEAAVPSNTSSGQKRIAGKAGFTGQLNLGVTGLQGSTPQQGSVAQGSQTTVDNVTFPKGTKVARFDLNATDNTDDLDLYLYLNGSPVAASATSSADEQITLSNPPAGLTVQVVVVGFADHNGGGIPFTYTGWNVRKGNQGNLTVTPQSQQVTVGRRFRYVAKWSGLDLSKRYFGYVSYSNGTRNLGERTYVTVN